MKILHVIGEMGYGGAELLTAEMGIRLVTAGHVVDVLVIGFCEQSVLERLAEGGVGVVRLNARLANPWNAIRIARIASSGAYDVVHAHLFPALYWAAIARTLASSHARWFYTEHSTSNGRRSFPILRGLERLIYRRYDRLVCISPDVASSLEKWLPGLSPVIIGNGIDVVRFRDAIPRPRADLGVPDSMKVVLMVGAFRKEKNHAILVDALALLPTSYVVVFAGDGPERMAVERLAHRLGVDDRVRFLGVVGDIERLLKSSDVFVLPSFFEGFGLSAIEACAGGLPVIHSDVPGLSAVLDGVGWPIDPADPKRLAERIVAVCARGSEVEAKCELAKELAFKYGLDATVAGHISLYTDAAT